MVHESSPNPLKHLTISACDVIVWFNSIRKYFCMHSIVVVNKPKDWNLHIPDVEVVSAKAYLTDSLYSEIRNARVYNLCQSYRYQGLGYYVSLLAEARGHRSIPNITTIQDLKSQSIIRIISDELDNLIQRSLSRLKSTGFILNIYFGNNPSKQYENLIKNGNYKIFFRYLSIKYQSITNHTYWNLRALILPKNEYVHIMLRSPLMI